MSTAELSGLRVGTLRIFIRERVGLVRTTKCFPPQIISSVSRRRVWSWTDGVRFVLMIRLPHGDQKVASMRLSRKNEWVFLLILVLTALTKAVWRA